MHPLRGRATDHLLAACLLGLMAAVAPAAEAQGLGALTTPAASVAASKPPVAPALTPAETRQMIDLLNDPQKRAAFTATLETLAKAQAVVNPAKPAAPAVPLAPDSVGAQVLREGTSWLSGLSGQLVSFGRVLGDLPSVWAFTVHTIENPVLRARVLDTGWRLAAVLAAALLAEWGIWRLLRRPTASIAARAPDSAEGGIGAPAHPATLSRSVAERVSAEEGTADLPDVRTDGDLIDPDPLGGPALAGLTGPEREDAEVEHVLRGWRFARTVRALKRLPFVLLCLVLDLLPLGVFLAIGYAGALFVMPDTQAVLQAALLAYALCRLATSATRFFVAPDLPALRLVHVTDQGAAYALVWVRRIFAVGAFGYAASQIGQLFGLPAAANDAFLKAVFLIIHLFLIVIVLQCRGAVAERIRSHSAAPSLGARVRNRVASIWHLVAIFYIAALWLVWAAEVRNGYVRIWHLFLVTIGVLILARLVSIVVLGGLDRALRISPDTKHRYPGLEQRANRYLPMLRSTVSGVLIVITCLALLQAWGINTIAWFRANALGSRLASATVTILIAAALAVAVWEAVNASMDRHLARLTQQAQLTKSARLRTLLPILRTSLFTALAGVFGLTALSEIGVNIAPLLAGAGILGVAIGFGSQKLVQDFITGIFLLLENAMQVGDWVTVAGLSGSVENLSIRTMRLRAGDGSVHIIPFSSVSTVTNVNRGIGNAAVSVNVPIEEDSDRVSEILTDIAREMRAERRFAEMMRSDFQLWGIDRVDAGVVTIVGQIVCTDSGRWGVQREFNRRMSIRFKQHGIRVASPVQTVHTHLQRDPPKPVLAQRAGATPSGQLHESPPPAALGNTS
jgi:small-conductance mechanosensitive channel